jgi:tRNA(Ile)-lysidine synthase
MGSFLHRVLETIRQHDLVLAGDRIAVALSGGPDSVALTWALRDLVPELACEIAGLVHVNHGLRGDEASRDETFCRRLAERLGVPIDIAHVDVRAEARRRHVSREAAARDLRYTSLAAAAARLGASRVATGHTLDDQAETVLLRLLRGAGSRGLSGVRVSRGPIIRPLLECRRAEVRAYLLARGEASCEDSSNDDRSIPRNRIRHELVPVIDALAPGGVRALARVAALAADDEQYLMEIATAAASGGVLLTEDGVQLECAALAALPPAVGRRVVRIALERAAAVGGRWTVRHIDAVRRLAAAEPTGGMDLPGVRVDRRGARLLLTPGSRPEAAAFDYPLGVPGSLTVPEAGIAITADVADRIEPGLVDRAPAEVAVLQAAAVALPLRVRSRRPGDRMKPLGAPGRRKLQDVFVDRKIPRLARDRVPVVEDASGRIVWVVGVTVADDCRVTAPEAKVVILRVRPV